MKIKCLTTINKYIQTENEFQDKSNLVEYNYLEIGKIYTVYGMIIDRGQLCYYICDRSHQNFPISRPFNLFELVDRRPSRYWLFFFTEGYRTYPCWMFPEWFDNPYFQDRLTDGEKEEIAIFLHYKKLMDLEYPDDAVKEHAGIADEKWLLCPICINAWESVSKDGMVICPSCHNIMHNPRYNLKML